MFKAGLTSCWNKKLNTESYFPANKRSASNLNLSSLNDLPCENFCFVECSVSMRQKDIGILKVPAARCVEKEVD